jgi:hypothetical protein
LGLKGTEPNKGKVCLLARFAKNLDELGKGILRSLPHGKEKNTCKFKGNFGGAEGI